MTGRIKHILAYISVITIVFIILSVSLYKRKAVDFRYARMQMGTIVEITVSASNVDENRISEAVEAAFQEIERLEALFSSYRNDSDISRINAAAGKRPVKADPEVVSVIERSMEIARISGGAFDPTVGVLGRVWSFSSDKRMEIPSRDKVAELLEMVNFEAITVDSENSTVKFDREGLQINLGGIAKGYIVGRAAEVLKRRDIKRGIVKAGGDMVVFDTGNGEPFKIGIQHPRDPNVIIGEVTFYNEAVATSGDYERYIIRDGVRYHHILDPSTGFPARKSQAVTVVSVDPTITDALSTAIFVMGPEKGMKLIESLHGVEGLIIDDMGLITASSGLKDRLVIKDVQKSELP
jgi:thiamine biosynthesis lipoprotein